MKTIKKHKGKLKNKKIIIKLSDEQIKKLDNACKTNKTTRNKIIKNAIKNYLNDNNYDFNNLTESEKYLRENQLQLYLPD